MESNYCGYLENIHDDKCYICTHVNGGYVTVQYDNIRECKITVLSELEINTVLSKWQKLKIFEDMQFKIIKYDDFITEYNMHEALS